jgi:hypothetical protein
MGTVVMGISLALYRLFSCNKRTTVADIREREERGKGRAAQQDDAIPLRMVPHIRLQERQNEVEAPLCATPRLKTNVPCYRSKRLIDRLEIRYDLFALRL